ncbi:succinylglutamate desuccinylase/aspartoacylase family protein [Muriicola sp. Z0-33]|uniref:succinylglutamate desuccinylase/aspartoacylase family protein n=1 Tax=Muriicola sp. Z0-33 TaxID=2816957 RepID=UPI002238DC26|nr:succinylglutamate desuccinylase/aspartoacylase family protein [Muriicola sp. Z0-33]MCW5514699.1 succinylglutamate desuccinylase/aspartoacylase family protein [Muriicola sp. Z0-33]
MIQTQPIISEKSLSTRLIGEISGQEKGPTFILFGGIHGNEPAGILALERVFDDLKKYSLPIKGKIYGIRGNLKGLSARKRFLDHDLNRLWTNSNIPIIRNKAPEERSVEEAELMEIYALLKEILDTNTAPFYFIDIHTTSSRTVPFITINDALINRRFSRCFPLPVVLGIEEYLHGPLLSYINERGYLAVGIESGQHDAVEAVDNAISFIWIALVSAELIPASELPELKVHYHKLKNATYGNRSFYEILSRRELFPGDQFKMEEGFQSFEKIPEGILLAEHNGEEILAPKDSIIFMPLYQVLGKEGFFFIRKIPIWALRVSEVLRKFKWDNFFSLFPGVSWTANKESLKVNIKIAKFFRKPIFHLFGYRRGVLEGNKVVMSNRESKSKKDMYKHTAWFRRK